MMSLWGSCDIPSHSMGLYLRKVAEDKCLSPGVILNYYPGDSALSSTPQSLDTGVHRCIMSSPGTSLMELVAPFSSLFHT